MTSTVSEFAHQGVNVARRSKAKHGRGGSLVKVIWHDGIGMALYAKRLEKGRFVWPSATDGTVSLTASQLACLLEGIDWRNPQYSWRPQSAG